MNARRAPADELSHATKGLLDAATRLAQVAESIPFPVGSFRLDLDVKTDLANRAAARAEWNPKLDQAELETRQAMEAIRCALDILNNKRGKTNSVGRDGKRYPRRPYENLDERVSELRQQNWTIRAIATEIGCSVGTVHRILKKGN